MISEADADWLRADHPQIEHRDVIVETKSTRKASKAKCVRSALELRETLRKALEKGGSAAVSAKVIRSHMLMGPDTRRRFYEGMARDGPARRRKKARPLRTVRPR